MSRRQFLKASTLVAPVLASTSYLATSTAQAQSPGASDFAQKANAISEKLFANDGLAIPIATTPTISPLAKGLDRTMVLGGGGEYYIAWYCGFFSWFARSRFRYGQTSRDGRWHVGRLLHGILAVVRTFLAFSLRDGVFW